MKLYKYFEDKFPLLESSNNPKYYYNPKNKTLYPIVKGDKIFLNGKMININKNNYININGDYLEPKLISLKIVSQYQSDEPSNLTLTPKYLEHEGIYYPLEEIKDYQKSNPIISDITNYSKIKEENLKIMVYTKGKGSSGGNVTAEVNELENLTATNTETPPEGEEPK